jgi:hypothetical protein
MVTRVRSFHHHDYVRVRKEEEKTIANVHEKNGRVDEERVEEEENGRMKREEEEGG